MQLIYFDKTIKNIKEVILMSNLPNDKTFFHSESFLKSLDKPNEWNSIIANFILEDVKSNNTKMIEKTIREFLLFNDKHIGSLVIEDLYKYEKYIYFKVINNEITIGTFTYRMKKLIYFFVFLYRKEFINYLITEKIQNGFKVPLKIASPKKFTQKNKSKPPVIVEEFITFLTRCNYSVNSTGYKNNILHFINYIKENFDADIQLSIDNKDSQTFHFHLNSYQQMLKQRVSLEEIISASAYHYIRTLKLFIKFLKQEKYFNYDYCLNNSFNSKGSRGNEYVPSDDVIKMLDMIYEHSNNIYRDLSIVLTMVDTGCRSIEISNIKVKDINLIERTIQLKSRKSGIRKLQLSREVTVVIKDYLSIRHLYNPEHDFLFVTSDGNKINNHIITQIFKYMNAKAFNGKKYSPKSIRHTYITNALENNTNLDKVSKIAGHKHWISTFYYLHRSKKLLLENTLNHSPLKEIGGI
jgi:site-specific recombinase XerD